METEKSSLAEHEINHYHTVLSTNLNSFSLNFLSVALEALQSFFFLGVEEAIQKCPEHCSLLSELTHPYLTDRFSNNNCSETIRR